MKARVKPNGFKSSDRVWNSVGEYLDGNIPENLLSSLRSVGGLDDFQIAAVWNTFCSWQDEDD